MQIRKCSPWYSCISNLLQDAKMKRYKAERHWLTSGLTVHKEIYVVSKKTVIKIIHDTKLAYFSLKIADCTNLELIGVCLLSSARRQWWNVSAVGFTIEANLRLISDVSWCLWIHLMLRKDDLMEGGSGILRSRLQSSAKWSDVSSFKTKLDTRIFIIRMIYDPI